MKNIILTGFKPFGPYKFNPVEESTRHFNKKRINNYLIHGLVLPCTYLGAFDKLKKSIDKINPYAIISTGLSSSIKGVRFETTGRNIMNGKYPDANGYVPNGLPIIKNGQEFINTNSDHSHIANILYYSGIPTETSNNADGFICNSLIYLTSNYIKTEKPHIKNTFIHVPWTENYKNKIELEPHKIMIPKETLHKSIETIIKNI